MAPRPPQFERFRRILYTPYYTTLLSLSDWELTSALEVSESQWVARVHVVNAYRREERDYSFFMEQRFGGKYDGCACDGVVRRQALLCFFGGGRRGARARRWRAGMVDSVSCCPSPTCRFWYTSKLLAEGCSAKTLYGVI
jgi:hypothetical protein